MNPDSSVEIILFPHRGTNSGLTFLLLPLDINVGRLVQSSRPQPGGPRSSPRRIGR